MAVESERGQIDASFGVLQGLPISSDERWSMKADVLEKVKARLVAKSSLSSFTTAGENGYLVKFSTLARYRRENPDFNQLVVSVMKDSNSRAQARRRQRSKNDAIREQNNDYHRIVEMVPRYLPRHVRDEVVQTIFSDLLAGSLKREDVRTRIRDYVAAQNRMFPTRFAKFGDGKLVSLDEVLFEGGATTRGDTISHGLWD
jgi:hypothetical protein